MPEHPELQHDPDQAIDAAALQAHAGGQQQQHGQSDSRHSPGGSQARHAAAAVSEPTQSATAPAAAAPLAGVDSALEELLQRCRGEPSDLAQPALAQALLRLRDGVLDRALPASFNMATWTLLREHLTRAAPAAAAPAQTLQQVRTQLLQLVRPAADMPTAAAQSLHLLLPLLLLHAERPRRGRHLQRTLAMLDTLCAGMEGVRA
ncbi:type III secretion system export control protein [Xanthomonas hyacinthi]|nr:type III secretion system export control protein [Xanthomonas hyacinthi]